MPEVLLRSPLPNGLQPDGSVRITMPDSDIPTVSQKNEPSWGLYLAGKLGRIDLGFAKRGNLVEVLDLVTGYTNFDPAEQISRKTSLIESVAEALTNDNDLPPGQLLHLQFTTAEIIGVDANAVTLASQKVVNEAFLAVLSQTSLIDGVLADRRTERVQTVLDKLDLSDSFTMKQLRMRVVAQGKSVYPSEALEVIRAIEEKPAQA
ncbi:MAG: hypothetical protein Q7R49_03900 [Candidatus Daviesbacteria bacterium]|nr:hypothetical protein [Candidatus Daviesbacteria bacterium]